MLTSSASRITSSLNVVDGLDGDLVHVRSVCIGKSDRRAESRRDTPNAPGMYPDLSTPALPVLLLAMVALQL